MIGYRSVLTNQGGGGGSYTAGDGIDITNDVISTKQSEEGDIDEIIDTLPPLKGNLVSIVNAFNKGDIYSTDEKMIGQWIDGKPLYQKVFPTTATMGSSYTIMISDTTEYNIAGIVKCYGIRYYPVGTTTMQSIPMLAYIDVNASAKPVYCYMYGAAAQFNYIILQYTKTTDTAISIGEATEYSTEEKVVGTWVDGKPVWQKVLEGTTPSAKNNSSETPIGCTIDSLVSLSGFIEANKTGWLSFQNIGSDISTMGITDDKSKVSVYIAHDYIISKPIKIIIQYTKTTT